MSMKGNLSKVPEHYGEAPTKLSELENDAGYAKLNSKGDFTVPGKLHAKEIDAHEDAAHLRGDWQVDEPANKKSIANREFVEESIKRISLPEGDSNSKGIPAMYTEERDSVLKKVQKNEADFRIVTFADPHSYEKNKYKKYNDLLNTGCIDALVGLGDYQIYSSTVTKEDTIINLTEALSHAGRTPNCFYAIGNHDISIKDANSGIVDQANILTKKELFDCTSRHLNNSVHFNENDTYGGYYYVDFEASKIRLIVLNTSDIYEPDGSLKYKYIESVMMQQPQITWLVEKALDFSTKDNPSDWGVLVCQHAYFDRKDRILSRILSAAKSGSNITDTWTYELRKDNPNTREYTNLYPLESANDGGYRYGIDIDRENDAYIIDGTVQTLFAHETLPFTNAGPHNEYVTLQAGVTYSFGIEPISGTTTGSVPVYIKTKTAGGTINTYENKSTAHELSTFEPAEDCSLIRFAISVSAVGVVYDNFKVKPVLTTQSELENAIDESKIATEISVNKNFSEQGAVSVIAVLYGHDHENQYAVSDGIPFIGFIADTNELDDFYKTSINGLAAGGYYITTNKGVKLGFTASESISAAKSIGYNQYFAQYGKSAPIHLYDKNGEKIKSYSARPENYVSGMTEITGFVQERTPGTIKTESCNVVSIDKDARKIIINHYGTGIDKVINF